jgi:hypothetical protein
VQRQTEERTAGHGGFFEKVRSVVWPGIGRLFFNIKLAISPMFSPELWIFGAIAGVDIVCVPYNGAG